MNASSERSLLQGAAGDIEVLQDAPADGQPPRGTAVIAHPHPLFGGTMDNKVVQTLARAFVLHGWRAVRFNFRGVGRSAGDHDKGRGELDDLRTVVAQCAAEGPLALAGFSFGSFVAAGAVSDLAASRDLRSLVFVGTAVSRFPVLPLAPELHERALLVHGEQDDTVTLADVMDWARPQNLPVTVMPGASHFFHGQLTTLRGVVLRHLRATCGS